jgi:hypothetical protein
VHALHLTPNATRFEDSVSSPFSAWSFFFAGILIYVCAISVYDGYLVLRTGDMIRDFELNPVGLLLIDCNGGDPSLFLVAKMLGTLLVIGLLSALNHRSQRLARPVAFTLAAFQSGLLIFLENC